MKRNTLTSLAALSAAGLALVACGGSDSDAISAVPELVQSADTGDTGGSGEAAAAEQPDTDATASSRSDEDAALEFAQCMRDEGIDYVDPQIGADGSIDLVSGFSNIDPSDTAAADDARAAFEVCGKVLDGTSLLPDQSQLEANEEALLEFAQCLRDEGIDVNDPDIGSFGESQARGPGALFGPSFDMSNPDVQAAAQTCAPIMADSGLGG